MFFLERAASPKREEVGCGEKRKDCYIRTRARTTAVFTPHGRMANSVLSRAQEGDMSTTVPAKTSRRISSPGTPKMAADLMTLSLYRLQPLHETLAALGVLRDYK